jgi:Zn-dependent metalloprotease
VRRCGCCWIVPPRLLRDLQKSTRKIPPQVIPHQSHAMFAATLGQIAALAPGRPSGGVGTPTSDPPPDVVIPDAQLESSPTHLFDCANTTTLPGTPIAAIGPGDAQAGAVAATTAEVLRFYATVLGRDPVFPADEVAGGLVLSTLNFGQNFVNAYWSGQMMVYGNGDRQVFANFWAAPDVICHEITHGITRFESGLIYAGESGAVNESISDAFAAVYSQWRRNLPAADETGWRLGGAILGPAAIARGFICLRDMASPTASHCLTYQPSLYPNIDDDDVHRNSGVPNRAFSLFARAVGGNAWESPIKLWYAAATKQGLQSNATIADFAAATLRAAGAWTGADKAALTTALQAAWATVLVTPTA